MDNSSDPDEENSTDNVCECCFKHPVVVKLGARLAQAAFPHLADEIDKGIDNITEAMINEPDNSIDHIMEEVNKSVGRKRSSLVDSEFGLPPCVMDVGLIGMDILGLATSAAKFVDLKKVMSGTGAIKPLGESVSKLGGKVPALIKGLKAIKTASSMEKMNTVLSIGSILSTLKGTFVDILGKLVGAVLDNTSWWQKAFLAVKLMAQIALWFATGLAALIATIVQAIVGLVDLVLHVFKLIQGDDCFSSWDKFDPNKGPW